ncbi:MAG: hypothetical protein JNM43_28340 [Planctomycetaceae bacterium]|nr:hypothetical protein [Planctomycetaceae bacterium]
MLVPLRGWFLLLVILSIAAFSYYRTFDEMPLPVSADDRMRLQLAERWAQKVSFEVKRLPGRPLVAVSRVVNDDHGTLTEQLKKWIARRNVQMVNNEWYSDLSYSAGVASEPRSIDEACQSMIGQGVAYIVAAEVSNWTTYPEFEATLSGHVEVRDGSTGEIVLQYQLALPQLMEVADVSPSAMGPAEVEAQDDSPSVARISTEPRASVIRSSQATSLTLPTTSSSTSVLIGFTIWLAVIASFPLSSANALKHHLKKRNNRVNGTILSTWIVVTGILAVMLWLRLLPLAAALPTGFLAIFLATIYFGFCCQFLAKTL